MFCKRDFLGATAVRNTLVKKQGSHLGNYMPRSKKAHQFFLCLLLNLCVHQEATSLENLYAKVLMYLDKILLLM